MKKFLKMIVLAFFVGRGIGGILGFVGLTFLEKDLLLKVISTAAVFICVLYLLVHYCCLKPFPYTRQYDYDRPATYAPSGRYTPLKLINGKKGKNLAKEDEDLDEKEINGPDDDLWKSSLLNHWGFQCQLLMLKMLYATCNKLSIECQCQFNLLFICRLCLPTFFFTIAWNMVFELIITNDVHFQKL